MEIEFLMQKLDCLYKNEKKPLQKCAYYIAKIKVLKKIKRGEK